METKMDNGKIFVRIERGEEVLDKLQDLRKDYGISNGFFEGIGAVDKVRIGHYNVSKQEYDEKEFQSEFEVSNFKGNIGPDKIHAHITLADNNFETIAGHCSFAKVSGTFELIIFVSDEPKLNHKYESETGLDVLDLSD